MFEELVGLIDKIKDDSIGEWIVDKENDGISRCIAKIYVRSLSYYFIPKLLPVSFQVPRMLRFPRHPAQDCR